MIGALTQITLRQWRGHVLRVTLATFSIALGVAAFFAICTANADTQQALRLTVERIAGKATLQITAGEAGVGEGVLEQARQFPGVALAEPVIEVLAQTSSPCAGNLLVLGLDIASGASLHAGEIDHSRGDFRPSLEFIAQPDSLALAQALAERCGLRIGSRLLLNVASGRQTFTVRGLFTPVGLAEVYGGNLAIVDVYAAQVMFARGRSFDRVDLQNGAGVTVEALRQRLKAAFPGLEVERPAMRGQQLEATVATMQFGFLVSSFVAQLVAVYIILNAFTSSITQRRKELGVLRALGVTRTGVVGMLLGEALLMGAAGALLGVIAGQYLAVYAARLMAVIAASSLGVAATTPASTLRLDYAASAIALGVAASALGAWLPARAASRLDPTYALHNIEISSVEYLLGWKRAGIGLGLLAGSTALIVWSPPSTGTVPPLLLGAMLLAGVVIVLPKLVELVSRALRPLLDRLGGAAGALAVDAMLGSPGRSAAAVGALVIGTTFVFSTGAMIDGYKRLVQQWMDRVINADLVIAASSDVRSINGHFREELGEQLAQVPGISRLERVRYTNVPYQDERVALVATDMPEFLLRAGSAISLIDPTTARQQLLSGEGVLVSGNFKVRWGLTSGEVLHLNSPAGRLAFRVAGVVDDYRSEKGAIFVSRTAYRRAWSDNAIDFFDIRLANDADPPTVRGAVERLVSAAGSGIVYTNAEYRRWVGANIDRYFLLDDAQLVIAVVVALLGIINTLAVSIVERRHEIGITRALGATRSQVRNHVLFEGLAIALAGTLIGAAVSALAILFVSRSIATAMAGYGLPYVIPWMLMALTTPVVVAGALLAGWWPARTAARSGIVEAIACE